MREDGIVDLNEETMKGISGGYGVDDEALKQIERLHGDIHNAFSTESGRRVLEWMRQEFGSSSFILANGDPYKTAFYEGQRYFLLTVETIIKQQESK